MVSSLSDEEIHRIMNFEPDKVISSLYTKTPTMDNQIFLGSKSFLPEKTLFMGISCSARLCADNGSFQDSDSTSENLFSEHRAG